MPQHADTSTQKNDTRVPCKYGASCYQKNEAHHKKYKHPDKKTPDKTTTTLNDKNCSTKIDQSSSSVSSTSKDSRDGRKMMNLRDWLKPPNKKQKIDESEPVNRLSTESEGKLEAKNDSSFVEKSDSGVSSSDSQRVTNDSSDSNCDVTSSGSSKVTGISIVPLKMDAKSKCKAFFLMDMPEDFYKFWEFCESIGSLLLSKGEPLEALKSVGLKLVGPFEVLANKFNENVVYNNQDLLRHYRFYYDPPEFQTVIIKTDDPNQYHLGYFRDDPKEDPVFVASNLAGQNGIIKPVAGNLFGALNVYLDDFKTKADPFAKSKVVRLQNSLTAWAKKENISLSTLTVAMKKRQINVVTKTFHKAGLVVPLDKKTDVGYRELAESDETIKKILTNIVNSKEEEERKCHFSKLYPIITYANIANDECDFGTSLELGLDLFFFGSPLFHETIKRLMVTSYQLLQRDEFVKIIEAHLENRKKGSNLSIFMKN